MTGDNNKSDITKKSIALISVFQRYTGTSAAVLDYRDALIDIGYKVTIYQLVIPNRPYKYLDADVLIKGKKLFIRQLELPFNVLFKLSRNLPNITDDTVILTDPIMLNLNRSFKKSIIIFHDLREFSKFNHNPLRKLFYAFQIKNLKDNDYVIAISHLTESIIKRVVKKRLNIQVLDRCSRFDIKFETVNSRISVFLNGKKEVNVLYVAADRYYKNIKLFIIVAKQIEMMKLNLNIHFTLVSKLRKSTKHFLKKKRLTNIQIYETVDNLYDLYNKTDVLLFPSLIEGFGLPLVEAMSFGIPIIYSNKQPMTDIVGAYGIPVDPFEPNYWVKELITLLNKEKYKEMSILSYEGSKRYKFDNFKESLSEAMKNFDLVN
jgi:glycosyltransferase involved in cell wall biosynthesis